MKILEWLGIGRARKVLDGFVSQMKSDDGSKAQATQARNLRELLEDKCPWCEKSLPDHEYLHLTTIRFEGQDRVKKQQNLVEKLRSTDWNGCVKMAEMSVDSDSLDAYLIRCPEKRIGWIVRMIPFEYLHRSKLIESQEIDENHGRELTNLKEMNVRWQSFV